MFRTEEKYSTESEFELDVLEVSLGAPGPFETST
jgi:hypothetical protein